jgi:hypothetical protein
MYTSKEFVLDYMVKKNMPFYTLRNSDGILDIQEEEISATEAAGQLDDFLKMYGDGGNFNILLSYRAGARKATGGNKLQNICFRFRTNTHEEVSNTGNKLQNISHYTELTNRIMQLELEKNKMEFEHKLEALRLEYKDKQKETFLDNPNVQAALMNILGMWGNNGVIKTQGNPPINGTEILDDKTRLQEALKRLLKHDNDFINNICKLADLAENNPSTYKMAVNFLNNG